jgi:hypothetical protein
MRLDGSIVERRSKAVSLGPNSVTIVASEQMHITERDPAQWLYAATIRDPEHEGNSIAFSLPQKMLSHVEAPISADWHDDHVVLTSATYLHAVHVDDGGLDTLTDNYFDLLPHTPKRIGLVESKWRPEFRSVLPLKHVTAPIC